MSVVVYHTWLSGLCTISFLGESVEPLALRKMCEKSKPVTPEERAGLLVRVETGSMWGQKVASVGTYRQ